MEYTRSFAYHHPEMLPEWDQSNTERPETTSKSSAKKILWTCSRCAHQWTASVNNRHNGKGCPVCSGKNRVIHGTNDIATQVPEIARMWSVHNDTSPDTISVTSKKNILLDLPCGHTRTIRASRATDTIKSTMSLTDALRDLCVQCKKDGASLKNTHAHLEDEYSEQNTIQFSDLSYNSARRVNWTCKKNPEHTWSTPVYQRVNSNTSCPQCSLADKISMQEKELHAFLKTLLPEEKIITSDRTVLKGKELDFYIPEKNIAIEYNGLWWHSEDAGKDRNYHYDKWRQCDDQGIQLINVWEDDWFNKKEIIQSMLAHKVGASPQARVYARKTEVLTLTAQQAREFSDAHHIQGFVQGSIYLGLKDKKSGQIVAVSIWKKVLSVLRLERYCTSHVVVGGMGKLLAQALMWSQDNAVDQIVTFSDHGVSDGDLYARLGFVRDKEIKPDYSYLYQGKRVHKFNFRLKRFRNDPLLQYKDGLSERELAILNKIPRIWDSGKTRWVMPVR